MKRKTFKKIRRYFFITLISLFLFSLFYVYLETGFFTIHTYKLVGVPEEYQQTLQEKFSDSDKQKIYKLLPGNRIISYHSSDIKSAIHELLPNTASISISIRPLHTLEISVSSYKPLFKVGERQAITKDAIVYTEIQDTSNLPTLSFATSSDITPQILSQVSDIIPKITATIFPVQSINIDEYSDIYIHGNGSSSAVIISEASDVKKIWSNLVSAIDTEPLKSKLETNKNHLEYLDTRFGNKVFYKFTNDSKTTIIKSHDNTLTATTTASTTISR